MNKKRSKKTSKKPLPIAVTILLLVCAAVYCYFFPPRQAAPVENGAMVHFIDVGQADSILITSGGDAMLIDAGENGSGEKVADYLRSQGVEKLSYVVGTHPHEDHIGGLDDVINAFEVSAVIMPKKQADTQTFDDVLDAIIAKNLTITAPVPGTEYALGDCRFTIIAPNDDYGDNTNNWSVGIKLTCGETSFVMCGDAEFNAEDDIINAGFDLRADVLKCGHHGSDTSTTDEFLAAVNPSVAVISCGLDNKYNHPSRSTLEKLDAAGVQYYRTDEKGTIIASTDGKTITWDFAPTDKES